jgi:hypothetical protein
MAKPRVREREESFKFRQVFSNYNLTTGALITTSNTGPFTQPTRYESISDIVDHPFGAFKYVNHTKVDLQVTPITGWLTSSYRREHYSFPCYSTGTYSGLFPFMSSSSAVPSILTGQQAFIDGAVSSWDPIPADTSLANSLLEFKELKYMGVQFADIAKRLSRLKLRSRDLSGAFLAHYFGVRPLISDIESLKSSVNRIIRRMAFIRNTNGRPVTLASSKVWNDPVTPGVLPGSSGGENFYTLVESSRYTLTIGCKLRQSLKFFDDGFDEIRALIADQGLNRPFAIAWNAIPYSFLIDWLYDVSSRLSTIEIPVFQGSWKVSSPWTSLKLEGQATTWFWPYSAQGNPKQRIVQARVRRYIRRAGLPGTAVNWTVSPLQQALIAALIHQNT